MDVQALTTLVGFAMFALAMFAYLANMKRDLKADIAEHRSEMRAEFRAVRSEIREGLSEVRGEMRTGFSDLGQRVSVLEQRTFDLSQHRPTGT